MKIVVMCREEGVIFNASVRKWEVARELIADFGLRFTSHTINRSYIHTIVCILEKEMRIQNLSLGG